MLADLDRTVLPELSLAVHKVTSSPSQNIDNVEQTILLPATVQNAV